MNKKFIGDLTEREAQVLAARVNGRSLKSIGNQLGLTRERIRQIEYMANKKTNNQWKAFYPK